MTMSLVQTVTVGSGGASTIIFDNIPQDATDLMVLVSGRASWASAIRGQIQFNFNGEFANYSGRHFGGYNNSIFQSNDLSINDVMRMLNSIPAGLATANTFNNVFFYVPNYTASSGKVPLMDGVMENNAAASGLGLGINRWNNNSAITAIRISHDQDLFVQHSTASLYKITKA